MKLVLIAILILLGFAVAAMAAWRQMDHRADRDLMKQLGAMQAANPLRFNRAMVAGLPEPAQRYFSYTISEGTPLFTVARLEMTGKFSMGTKTAPNYMTMSATQILAVPHGFIWKVRTGSGLMTMSGSDTQSWTRFWLAGLAPVARFGGDFDHRRSAFGRYVAEAVFWTPAALLPGPGIKWKAIDETSARVTITHDGLSQPVDVHVGSDGQPLKVVFPRWTNANTEKAHQIQPFGGYLSEYRDFDGFRLPTHVEAGNVL